MDHALPFRPVAPEQACRASRMTIDGGGTPLSFLCLRMWYTTEAPAYPAPTTAMSTVEGSSGVLRWSSIGRSSVLQKESVELATGSGEGAMLACRYTVLFTWQ